MLTVLSNRLRCWSDVGPSGRQAIGSLPGKRMFLARGDDPFAGGVFPDHALLMLDGWAAEYIYRPTGHRVIVELLLPGDLTNLDPHAMNLQSVGIVMLSSGCVQRVPLEAIQRLLRDEAVATALRCAELMREAVRREWLVNVGSRKVDAGLAHLLCELSVRAQQAGRGDGVVCEMPLTQSDLADALCVSEAHLNVAVQRLRKLDLVCLANKKLRILNWPALVQLAEFDDEYLRAAPVITQPAGNEAMRAREPGEKDASSPKYQAGSRRA